jgi:prepilin-type N-terminal cleavage/methylation domain-containing protein
MFAKRPASNGNKGFSLLESIVSIALLALTLSGILSLSSIGIRSAARISNQITAFFLASEAVEYIRNVRDSNVLAGNSWLTGLADCQAVNGCYIDAPNATISACAGACPEIKFNSSNNLFNYSSGNETIFSRQVLITEVEPSREVKLDVNISWLQGSVPQSFILEEHLFNLSFE